MIFFAGVFLIPLLIGAAAFFLSRTITWKEFAIQVAVQAVVAGTTAACVYHMNTSDDEVWSGNVTSKQREWTFCEHSYQCHCRQECSGSGKNRSCSQVCDTCYEHLNDYNWGVNVSTGDKLYIDRVDRQGTREPARFSSVVIGEPASVDHGYTNYVKAAPDTLFRRQGLVEKHGATLPAYPGRIYDYYRINRLVTVDTHVGDAHKWNAELQALNAEVGNKWQADVAVVLTSGKPREWFFALEEKWLGGKKNDVVLVINRDGDEVTWVEVMAWVKDPLFKVKLRDSILEDPKKVDREKVIPKIRSAVVSSYQRKPMKDFEYLKSSIRPSTTEWIVSLIIGLILGVGLAIFFHTQDVFNEE